MNQFTFTELCDALEATIERIVRLETLPRGWWDADYEDELEDLCARRDALRAAIITYDVPPPLGNLDETDIPEREGDDE